MVKFITQYSCWRLGRERWFIIASCVRTHEVRLVYVDPGPVVNILTADKPLPDIRLEVPVKWQALPYLIRCLVRREFQLVLEARYGAEEEKPMFVAGGDE